MSSLELSTPVFSILSTLLQEKVGLSYTLAERELLQDKVGSRAMELGYESLLDYYYFLRYDPAGEEELAQLVEHLVVNETYFFREWPAIQVMVNHYIAPLCAAGKRPKIWCAACSTGEEPISIAMLLAEKNLLDKVEIIASDISENALKKAKAGKFGRRAVRHVPDQNLKDKFISQDGDHHFVPTTLIDAIQWRRTNILDKNDYPKNGPFDAILCRNMLIYFNDETVKIVLDNLYSELNPDGVFLVGISESLLRFGSGFVGEERDGSFVYKKALNHEH
ncbi:MAG: protein-glutamate O-methyltransferase CheR [Bdellovibrionota bacterium]